VKLGDASSIFSRYVVVGFLLPAFFTLAVISLLSIEDLLPSPRGKGAATALGQIGGIAALTGLLLQGVWPSILEATANSTQQGAVRVIPLPVWRSLLALRRGEFDRLDARRSGSDPIDAGAAAWELDRRFPRTRERVLATRLGNATRATQDSLFARWGLDSISAWPRIEPLLADGERQGFADAETEQAFFLNLSIGALFAGAWLASESVAEHGQDALQDWQWWAGIALTLALMTVFYRLAVAATIRMQSVLRALVDLHRLDLYARLGVRAPKTFTEEREHVARHVNRLLLYGIPIPDDYTHQEAADGT
jgi:hypothetical protein